MVRKPRDAEKDRLVSKSVLFYSLCTAGLIETIVI